MKKKLLAILCICFVFALAAEFFTSADRSAGDGAVTWSNAKWDGVSDDEADSLPEKKLTIKELQTKANKERINNLKCKSLHVEAAAVAEDLQALSKKEIEKIKVAQMYDSKISDKEISKEDAWEDADLFAKICRSSYGSYYLYDRKDWDDADSKLKQWIQEASGDNIKAETLQNLILAAYTFVNDDHFRVNEKSTLDYSGNLKYYCYLKDVYFHEDDKGFYTVIKDSKWYLKEVGSSSDISAYIKPTITEEGELAYAVGTFLRSKDSLETTLTFSRGSETNKVSCKYTRAMSLREKNADYANTQAGLYDGYYVLGIRSFLDEPYEELCKYPETAKKLKGTSHFIIDSRGNGGGGDIWLEGFYENYSGTPLKLTINTTKRFSDLTNKFWKTFSDFTETPGLYEEKQDGSFAENTHLFAYLMDKDIGSAGERGILSIKQMKNTLLIGTNSRGCMLGDGTQQYILPNSKFAVTVGGQAFIEGNCSSDIEGLGWMPDIYVDGYLALDRTIKMYQHYHLLPDENVKNLPTWGERIQRFE